MKPNVLRAALLLACTPCLAVESKLTGFPFTNEDLTYRVNLPGGQQIGTAKLHAEKQGADWSFALSLDGGIPGFEIHDAYKGSANAGLCSSEFSRRFAHGTRKGNEQETVDRPNAAVTRITAGGGKSEFPVPDCTRDALGMLFYARRELGQGRVAQPQQILFGGLYYLQLTYTGPETIPAGGNPVVTDRVVCSLKGPASNRQFEILFARDAARTPLLFRIPILQGTGEMGKFSLELIR